MALDSTLYRLFTYAKADEAEALENFTTEALAAALREDLSPLLSVLRTVDVPRPPEPPFQVQVHSQVPIGTAGTVDLVVRLQSDVKTEEYWFEVKAHAKESGKQLSDYKEHVDSLPRDLRPALIVLSAKPLKMSVQVPELRWQAVWKAAAPLRARSPYWRDLRLFLEEKHMAHPYDVPATSREACALNEAYSLLKKMEVALVPVAEYAATLMPDWSWPTKPAQIQIKLANSFRWHGNFTLGHSAKYRAGIAVGVYRDDESGEAWAGVRVWANPKATTLISQLHATANKAKLSQDWSREAEKWNALTSYRRLATFDEQDNVAGWLMARLKELADSGLLKLIPTLGAPAPEEVPAGEDDEEQAD